MSRPTAEELTKEIFEYHSAFMMKIVNDPEVTADDFSARLEAHGRGLCDKDVCAFCELDRELHAYVLLRSIGLKVQVWR